MAEKQHGLAGWRVGQALRQREAVIAAQAVDAFLEKYPDWTVRHGEQAREVGLESVRQHLRFLGAAIEQRAPEAFRDYVHWAARVLAGRGIDFALLEAQIRHAGDAAGPYVRDEDRGLVTDMLAQATAPAATDHHPDDGGPLALVTRTFVQATLAGDRHASLRVALEALASGTSVLDLYADVFQTALHEVGRRWEANRISVAQEHMATAVTQYVMAHVFEHIPRSAADHGPAVITGVPGELHHVGAMMVADMLEANGWRVQFLSSNLPVPSIVDAVVEARPQLLGISVTMLFNVRHATEVITRSKAAVPSLRAAVGGAAFAGARYWRATGADLYASDVRGAVTRLCPERL